MSTYATHVLLVGDGMMTDQSVWDKSGTVVGAQLYTEKALVKVASIAAYGCYLFIHTSDSWLPAVAGYSVSFCTSVCHVCVRGVYAVDAAADVWKRLRMAWVIQRRCVSSTRTRIMSYRNVKLLSSLVSVNRA